MSRLSLAFGMCLGLAACAPEDSALLSLHVRVTPGADAPASLRSFDPDSPDFPPDRLRVLVLHASDLAAQPVAQTDLAWSELPTDTSTGQKYLLLGVSPNAGREDPYLLRLSSVLEVDGVPAVDECGAIGLIEVASGEKKQLDIAVHPGDCSLLCAPGIACVGSRYCLGFECQEALSCAVDANCPAGAHCQDGSCDGSCDLGGTDCPAGFFCCGTICSASCANPG